MRFARAARWATVGAAATATAGYWTMMSSYSQLLGPFPYRGRVAGQGDRPDVRRRPQRALHLPDRRRSGADRDTGNLLPSRRVRRAIPGRHRQIGPRRSRHRQPQPVSSGHPLPGHRHAAIGDSSGAKRHRPGDRPGRRRSTDRRGSSVHPPCRGCCGTTAWRPSPASSAMRWRSSSRHPGGSPGARWPRLVLARS